MVVSIVVIWLMLWIPRDSYAGALICNSAERNDCWAGGVTGELFRVLLIKGEMYVSV